MVTYEIYTFPNCQKCSEVKTLFEELELPYQEVSLVAPEGISALREIHQQYPKKLKRDKSQMIILPVVLRRNGSVIEEMVQGEEVRSFLSS